MNESTRAEHKLAAVAEAAARIAVAGPLSGTLDFVAAEVAGATGMSGCQIMLVSSDRVRTDATWDALGMRVDAVSGLIPLPDDFTTSLAECARRGAPFNSVNALRAGRPIVCRNRAAEVFGDPRWSPIYPTMGSFEWDTQVSVPLIVRGQTVGVLNGFYPPGRDPAGGDLAFLRTMCDQAAVAVENAGLLAELDDKTTLEERHRLARELHDSVCQALFSMTLHIRGLELALHRDDRDAQLQRRVGALRDLAKTTLAEMRAVVYELGPNPVGGDGLVAAVRRFAGDVQEREGLQVAVDVPATRLPLPAGVEEGLYRVVQETLYNVVKHAQAQRVRLRLGTDRSPPGRLVLEVSDDGVGFDPSRPPPGHLGLAMMRERVSRLGGDLTVDSAVGAGTTVRVSVPFQSHESSHADVPEARRSRG